MNFKHICSSYLPVGTLAVILFIMVLHKFGTGALLLKYLLVAFILITISLRDLNHHIIPNRFVLAGTIAAIISIPFTGEITFLQAIYGIASTSGFLVFIKIINRDSIGMGDIKLSAFVGVVLGWPLSLLAVIIAFCLAGLLATSLLITGRKKGNDIIPFGPFLSAGTFISFMWGHNLIMIYINII